ncbi:hypothetical protein NKY66_11145 [Sinorhizobium meliloti]|uniref:hypothetical protein n=1 Tax=Rhizobium meliloti TaxID=382 RepID=UPI003D646F55
MPSINPPVDHVEIAVSAVEHKLESVIGELRGLMQAADFAMSDAFDRAAAVHDYDKPPENQGEQFVRVGEEYQVHNVAYRKLKAVVLAAEIAHEGVQAARERYRTTRERGELAKLLGLFEAEDKKTEE